MRSSSLKLLNNSGIDHPREFRDKLIHEWYLQWEEIKYLDEHLLTAIPIEEFFSKIKEGEIQWGRFTYQIIWIQKPESIKKSGLAIVSFRFCKFLNCGYALVKKNNITKEKVGRIRAIANKFGTVDKEPFLATLLKRS